MDNQVKRNIGIWGPIAIDQFVIGNDGNSIDLEPRWGGCGLNQAIAMDKLAKSFSENRGAYLLSSVGPDFDDRLAQFQGYALMGLPELSKIEPVLHRSAEETTSWKVSITAPSNVQEEIDKKTEELKRRLSDNPRALRSLKALESQLYLFEQHYKAKGISIRDLEKSKNVEPLLKILDEKGFPMMMSVAGGTPAMQGTVIDTIRDYKKGPKPFIYYDPGPAFAVDPKMVLSHLSKVDIFRTNRDERYLCANKDEGVQSRLLQHNNLLAMITTKATEISTYLWDKGKIVRAYSTGLPFIRADTTGAGDIFGASFLWYLDGQKDRTPETIVKAVEFGMASAFVYMKQKRGTRTVGVPRYNITKWEIEDAISQIHSREVEYALKKR